MNLIINCDGDPRKLTTQWVLSFAALVADFLGAAEPTASAFGV